MIYTSVADIFTANDDVRRRLFARVGDLSAEQQGARSAAGGWSVAEIVEHLAIIERSLTQLLRMMLHKIEAGSDGAPHADANLPRAFTPFSLDDFIERARGKKFEAPESMRPSGRLSIADSIARLRESHAALEELRPRLEATDLTAAQYPHPAFGPLNVSQWLAFIGLHEERHVRQIERLLETLNAER